MKIKPASKGGGVIMELGATESQIPTPAPVTSLPPHPQFRLKRILVPVDFSDCSRKAQQYAMAFVEEFGGELFLVHVVEPYFVTGELGVDMIGLLKDAEKAARKHLAGLQKAVGPGCQTELRRGSPAQEIIDQAKDMGADLIIIATHGRSGIGHLFMGSVAERVVQHAPCPVLVVRQTERDFINAPSRTKTARRKP